MRTRPGRGMTGGRTRAHAPVEEDEFHRNHLSDLSKYRSKFPNTDLNFPNTDLNFPNHKIEIGP